jgi:predicted small lipoprotein YifL
MKRLSISLTAFLLLSVVSLTGCSRAGGGDVPANERFTPQGVSIHGLGANAYLIKDVKTGKEFLMIRMATGGLSVTPL